LGIGDWGWGLGIGDWGLGIGPNPQSPIPNPQSPIPNPQSPINFFSKYIIKKIFYILNVNNNLNYLFIDKYKFFKINNK
jgi:hypothetical protein